MYNRQKNFTGGNVYMPENNFIETRDCRIDLSVLDGDFGTNVNKVLVIGTLKGNFNQNYTSSLTCTNYYRAILSVSRKSGVCDNIRLMVPESLIYNQLDKFVRGVRVKISGVFCSYLHTEVSGKKRLALYVFAEKIELIDNMCDENNVVYLEGEVIKVPYMRTTASGMAITDIFISVKRENHTKYEYIPCILWGRLAHIAKELQVGDRIVLAGRIQSRMYYEQGQTTKRQVHEVSAFGILDITKGGKKQGK